MVRPPTEVLTPDGVGVQSSQWPGGHNHTIPSGGVSNRHSWAGSNNSCDHCSTGIFDWRPSDDKPMGLEDVRVCSDCYSGVPGRDDRRGIPGGGLPIHRTWNGSPSPATQARATASGLWVTPGLNTVEPIGRRRQSVSKVLIDQVAAQG